MAKNRAQAIQLSSWHGRNWIASVYHEYGVLHSKCSNGVTVALNKPSNSRKETISPSQRSSMCIFQRGNVYLTPIYDAACNLTRSRALCGVKEINLSVCDTLLLQLVHIQ